MGFLKWLLLISISITLAMFYNIAAALLFFLAYFFIKSSPNKLFGSSSTSRKNSKKFSTRKGKVRVKSNDLFNFSNKENFSGIKRRRKKLDEPGSFLTATKRGNGILSFTRSRRLPGERVETLNLKTGKKTTRRYTGKSLITTNKLTRTKKPAGVRKPIVHKGKKIKTYSAPKKRR